MKKNKKMIAFICSTLIGVSSLSIPIPIFAISFGEKFSDKGIIVGVGEEYLLDNQQTYTVLNPDGDLHKVVNYENNGSSKDISKWFEFDATYSKQDSIYYKNQIISNLEKGNISSTTSNKEVDKVSQKTYLIKDLIETIEQLHKYEAEDENGEKIEVYIYDSLTEFEDGGVETDLENKEVVADALVYDDTENALLTVVHDSSDLDEEDKDEDEDEDNTQKPDHAGFLHEELLVEIVERVKENSSRKEYIVTLIDDKGLDTEYVAYFSAKELGDRFPTKSLMNQNLLLDVKYKPIVEGTDTILYVEDWAYESTKEKKSMDLTIEGIRYQKKGTIAFEVSSSYKSTELALFNESTLGKDFPDESLLGRKIRVLAQSHTQDFSTVEILDWSYLDSEDDKKDPDKDEADGQLSAVKTFRGTLDEVLLHSNDKKNKLAHYSFTDYDGNKYILEFNKDTKGFPSAFEEGRKITVEAYDKNLSGATTPVLQVASFEYNEDDFSHYSNEPVALTGKILRVENNSSDTRISYVFETEIELNDAGEKRTYTAVFDKTILNDLFPIESLVGQEIKLYGLTHKKDNQDYLGVLSYAYPKEEGSLSSSGGFEVLDVTPIRLVSQDDGELLYEGVSKNGEKCFILFSEEELEDFMPTELLIGKNLTVFTQYLALNAENATIDKNTIFRVNTWFEADKQMYKTERGQFGKLLQESSSAFLYEFNSSKGNKLEVLIDKSLHEVLLKEKELENLTDQVSSLYGYQRYTNGKEVFLGLGVNILQQEYIDQNKTDRINFRGFVEEVSNETTEGNIYFSQNANGEHALLFFDIDLLKDKYPTKEDLIGKEIVVTGFLYTDGVVLVSDFNYVNVPTEYPADYEPLYSPADYYPNLAGFTGMIDLIHTDKPYITLVTATRSYKLVGDEEVMSMLEDNLGNIVYLRGEKHEQDYTYWSGQIDVYDIAPLHKGNEYIKPINEGIPDLKPDPMKDAIHTLQLPAKGPDSEVGDAIIESTFLPLKPPSLKDGK